MNPSIRLNYSKYIYTKCQCTQFHKQTPLTESNRQIQITVIVGDINTQQWGIPRWRLEGGSRKRASYSEILEMLETHFAGIITEKRHNFDTSTPPASTDNLHFTLSGETRRASGRQSPAPRRLGKTQTRWASWYRGTPTDKPGPEQHSPLDRLTSTRGKKRETE
jgi:hypothetical protein